MGCKKQQQQPRRPRHEHSQEKGRHIPFLFYCTLFFIICSTFFDTFTLFVRNLIELQLTVERYPVLSRLVINLFFYHFFYLFIISSFFRLCITNDVSIYKRKKYCKSFHARDIVQF